MMLIDDIPTAPATPVSGVHDMTESACDEPFDMISSIDSLTPLSPARTTESFASLHMPSPVTVENSQPGSASTFVMPQPPTPDLPPPPPASIMRPLQSYLRADDQQFSIALAGNMAFSADLFAKIVSFMPGTSSVTSERGMDVYDGLFSSQGPNLLMFDTSFVGDNVLPWLETQLQSAQPVHAVIYSLQGCTRATANDVRIMQAIQKIAVLVVVADSDEDLVNLARQGVTGFQQHIWRRSDIPLLANTVLNSSEHILAMSAYLQNRWYESQLAVATLLPTGALCQRIDLRRKALASIANVDPLGIGDWQSLYKSMAWIVMNMATDSLADLLGVCLGNRLSFIPVGQITHHALFDFEHE